PSLKQLTDRISTFLLNNHSNGRNTVLIIDEAQHLKAEVLEQLRLLTNLETDTKKLLQVILIGQPELQQLLKRQELRQLAQRITARYHLLPLTLEEVGLYVQHRLQVAGRHEPLFHKSAIKTLHKHSDGIPRLINLLCERALMASYAQSKVPIDKNMINMASREVLGEEPEKKNIWLPIGLAASIILTFSGAFYLFSQSANDTTNSELNRFPASASNDRSTSREVDTTTATLSSSQRVLKNAMAQSRDIDTAYASILGLWEKAPYIGLSACQSAQQQGLSCYQQQGNWNSIVRLNFPAVVYLVDEQQQAFYGTVVARQGEQMLLQLNEQQLWVKRDWFTRHFSGTFEILWQAPHNQVSEIGKSANQAQLQWLENSLAIVTESSPRLVYQFDGQLEQAVKAFQRQHGLAADGIAGAQTLVQLNLYLSDVGPRLGQSKRLY
ncbi:ExeA family protein, partial [Shewanella sp. GutDb-MelDb]|uniref:ExeA family protein n=1 Tax=Shewanella sp. GutDb-MelDb TaxID=2058316 RepID=UPI000C79D9CD